MPERVRQGRWTPAGRGAVAPWMFAAQHPTTQQPTQRACAGVLHGLPVLLIPGVPELTGHDVWDGHRRVAHLWAAAIDDAQTTYWHGVPVETVGRTLVTVARHGRRDAIMAADAALREGLIGRAGLSTALQAATGWPWVRQARSVLALADPLAESPLVGGARKLNSFGGEK